MDALLCVAPCAYHWQSRTFNGKYRRGHTAAAAARSVRRYFAGAGARQCCKTVAAPCIAASAAGQAAHKSRTCNGVMDNGASVASVDLLLIPQVRDELAAACD